MHRECHIHRRPADHRGHRRAHGRTARNPTPGTRWRKLTCLDQAVLALRWFLDGTRVAQLACDNGIRKTTAYDYLHETIDALAAQVPELVQRPAGSQSRKSRAPQRGTLIYTDRIRETWPRAEQEGHASGSVVVQETSSSLRRQHPGHHRPGRLAAVDLGRTARPRARRHRAAHTPRDAARPRDLDRGKTSPCSAIWATKAKPRSSP